MMTFEPYRIIRIERDLSGVRAAIAEVLPAGQKMTFAKLAAARGDVARRLLIAWAESLAPFAEAEFDAPVTALLPFGTVRHHTTQVAERAPWHYDQVFFEKIGRGVTFWITLDDAGVTAPGVEFEIDGETIAPIVPAGSALMFGPTVRHRTQPIDGDRISCEFRCIPTAARTPECHAVIHANLEHREDGRWLACWRQGAVIFEKHMSDHGRGYTAQIWGQPV